MKRSLMWESVFLGPVICRSFISYLEINELYDRKRDMVLTFQREQAVYSEYIRDVKEKARTRLKEHLLFVRQDQDGKKNREHSQIV